jgi:hypothetical protein
MTTEKVHTDYMVGNRTSEVFELMTEKYDWSEMCNHHIDYDQAIFSDGFISAIKRGQLPILGTEKESGTNLHGGKEYHHLISDGVCYVVYFTEEQE